MSGDPLSDVREPIEQLGLQAKGFLDSLNAVLELGKAPGLREAEESVLRSQLPSLRETIKMVYEAVIGEAIPEGWPEKPICGLVLEPDGRMFRFYFDDDQSDDAIRNAIGGNLELVYMPPVNQYKEGLACFVDENGIEKGLSKNPRAAGLFPGLNPIFGRMIICGWDRHEDVLLDCPELIFEMAREAGSRT